MSAGASKDYTDNPAKTHWRRWWWNRIAERVVGPKKDALVLGLFGAQGLDVQVARAKGFDSRNLISVESNARAVRQARLSGLNAIPGDIADVVANWPESSPMLHCVMLDYCGSLSLRTGVRGLDALLVGAGIASGTVVAVNLWAGLEGEYRHEVAFISELYRDPLHLNETEEAIGRGHRGAIFWWHTRTAVYREARQLGLTSTQSIQLAEKLTDRPSLQSYLSNGKRFDSAVFSLGPVAGSLPIRSSIKEDAKLRRRIAAALAHRTRRLAA